MNPGDLSFYAGMEILVDDDAVEHVDNVGVQVEEGGDSEWDKHVKFIITPANAYPLHLLSLLLVVKVVRSCGRTHRLTAVMSEAMHAGPFEVFGHEVQRRFYSECALEATGFYTPTFPRKLTHVVGVVNMRALELELTSKNK